MHDVHAKTRTPLASFVFWRLGYLRARDTGLYFPRNFTRCPIIRDPFPQISHCFIDDNKQQTTNNGDKEVPALVVGCELYVVSYLLHVKSPALERYSRRNARWVGSARCPQAGGASPSQNETINPKNLSGRAHLDNTRCKSKSQSYNRRLLCGLFIDVIQIDVVENALAQIFILNNFFGLEPHIRFIFRFLHV